jgi:carbonic anhydrase/acetyltransferase-like protein (isoleucine patch superfamily)
MKRTAYQGILPTIRERVFCADGVQLIGDVTLEEDVSVWYNAVLRGDLAPIYVGARSNIQDGVIAHVNTNQPLHVAHDVSVGHGAIIHGCTIDKGCLIGMGAIVLNGAKVNEHVLLAAGSLVPEGKEIPPYTLAMGSPAKVVRELTPNDLARMARTVANYKIKGAEFRNNQEEPDR